MPERNHQDREDPGDAGGTSKSDVVSSARGFAAGTVLSVPGGLRQTIALSGSVFSANELADGIGDADRYLPLRELGQGGMGYVDVVFDRGLGRPVARKRLLEPLHTPLLFLEAQIVAQLEHPSIVPIYDIGRDANGRPHYTMRVINGRTLRDVLEDERDAVRPKRGLTALLGVLRQVCLAIDFAHTHGVVHRDLKPENIVVGEFGEVYVLDWGVAYLMESSDIRLPAGESTRDDFIAGTPGYMAPEQAMGQVDGRADVYALGVILYEMLVGRAPFPEENDLTGVVGRMLKPSLPPPSMAAASRVPAFFDDLVRRCLKRTPDQRPRSPREIADRVERFLDNEREERERESEASSRVAEGEAARASLEALEREADALVKQSQAMFEKLEPWDSFETKQPAWSLAERARRLRRQAARELAAAEAAFTTALSKVPSHGAARAGLAALHYREFLSAEAAGDADRMAMHLELTRRYDDGDLELELAGEGVLEIDAPSGAALGIARYEPSGPLLRLMEQEPARAHCSIALAGGSYVVMAELAGVSIRYSLSIERAKRHRLTLRVPAPNAIPAGMVLVPGGPFLALAPKAHRPVRMELQDFAISRFPVTLREFTWFLDDINDPNELVRRTPGFDGRPLLERDSRGRWQVTARCIEGEEARRRIPPGRELDLPCLELTWYTALAYTHWLSGQSGLPYRLPTDLEWEKAMRGADGRSYPMGNHIDPSFAKLRESRPEAPQLEPVGSFPLDESVYGVRDLAGGVTDWTATSLDGEPLPQLSDEGKAGSDRQAYVRGGHWGHGHLSPSMRFPTAVSRRGAGTGFRLALSLDRHEGSSLDVETLRG